MIGNHDVVRPVTRWGSATAAASRSRGTVAGIPSDFPERKRLPARATLAPAPAGWGERSVAAQAAGPDSFLTLYWEALRIPAAPTRLSGRAPKAPAHALA